MKKQVITLLVAGIFSTDVEATTPPVPIHPANGSATYQTIPYLQ